MKRVCDFGAGYKGGFPGGLFPWGGLAGTLWEWGTPHSHSSTLGRLRPFESISLGPGKPGWAVNHSGAGGRAACLGFEGAGGGKEESTD